MTEDELAVARSWRAGQLSVEHADARGRSPARWPRWWCTACPTTTTRSCAQQLLAADVAEVSAAAAAHLHPEALTLVVEGDAAVIRDDLAATGLGEVVDRRRAVTSRHGDG